MQGFVKSYYDQQQNAAHSQKIMHYFTPAKLPRPGPPSREPSRFQRLVRIDPWTTFAIRAFAHYGTSLERRHGAILREREISQRL